MGPLFSAALIILALVGSLLAAFVAARFFQRPAVAIRFAFTFVIGAIGGVALSGSLSILFVGVGTNLVATWQVVAYLSSLAVGGLFGGSLLLALYIKRSNSSFKRDALKRAP